MAEFKSLSFIDDVGEEFPLNVISYDQDILINYELMERSDRKRTSIDRGSATDRYATKLKIHGKTDYIKQLVVELTALRSSQKTVNIRQIKEPIFGDHIDHSGGIDAYVYDFGEEQTPRLNVQTLDITFIAQTSELIFTPDATLPSSLECLRNQWAGFGEWNTEVQETYNRDIYFVDQEADSYVFQGEYILSLEDNARLFNWWRSQRGAPYTLTEADWGVTSDMFGPVAGSGPHEVIINNISYENMSPNLRTVSVEILKN